MILVVGQGWVPVSDVSIVLLGEVSLLFPQDNNSVVDDHGEVHQLSEVSEIS
jgi:hypothetical protein